MTVVNLLDGELEEGGLGPWVEVPESVNYVITGITGNIDVHFSVDGISRAAIASQPKQISPANAPSGQVWQMTGIPVRWMRAVNRNEMVPNSSKVDVLGLV